MLALLILPYLISLRAFLTLLALLLPPTVGAAGQQGSSNVPGTQAQAATQGTHRRSEA
jgi:hypothetical protein